MPKYACDYAEQIGREAARAFIKQGNPAAAARGLRLLKSWRWWTGIPKAEGIVGAGAKAVGTGGLAAAPAARWGGKGPWLAGGGLFVANEAVERGVLNPGINAAAQKEVGHIVDQGQRSEKAPGWLPYALVGIPALTGAYALYQHLRKKKDNEATALKLEQDED